MLTFFRWLLVFMAFLLITTSLMLTWAWRTTLWPGSALKVDVKAEFVVKVKKKDPPLGGVPDTSTDEYYVYEQKDMPWLNETGSLAANNGATLDASTVAFEPAKVKWTTGSGNSKIEHTAPGIAFRTQATIHAPNSINGVQLADIRWNTPVLKGMSKNGYIDVKSGRVSVTNDGNAFAIAQYPMASNFNAFLAFYLGWAVQFGFPPALGALCLTIWLYYLCQPKAPALTELPSIPAYFGAKYIRTIGAFCMFPILFGLLVCGIGTIAMAWSSPNAYSCMGSDALFVTIMLLISVPMTLLTGLLTWPQAKSVTLTEQGIDVTYINFGRRRKVFGWPELTEVTPMEVRKSDTKQLIDEYLLLKPIKGSKIQVYRSCIENYEELKQLATTLHATLGPKPPSA